MSEQFPEPEFDLSNYATKANLQHATGVDFSKFSGRFDLLI